MVTIGILYVEPEILKKVRGNTVGQERDTAGYSDLE